MEILEANIKCKKAFFNSFSKNPPALPKTSCKRFLCKTAAVQADYFFHDDPNKTTKSE